MIELNAASVCFRSGLAASASVIARPPVLARAGFGARRMVSSATFRIAAWSGFFSASAFQAPSRAVSVPNFL